VGEKGKGPADPLVGELKLAGVERFPELCIPLIRVPTDRLPDLLIERLPETLPVDLIVLERFP
jgi:hypothetical protein